MSTPRERLRDVEGPHFGVALLLMVLSIMAAAFADQGGWSDVLALALQGGTLLVIIEAGDTSRLVRYVSWAVVMLGLVVGALAVAIGGKDSNFVNAALGIVGVLLAVTAPIAVVRSLVRTREITVRVAAGALLLYLLIGQFFVFVYRVVDATTEGPFFAQVSTGPVDPVDYTYFSFVTLTTVGYGDLTLVPDVGRMLAVSEALIGQLYLVSVVALVMGRLGQRRYSVREPEPPDLRE